MTEPADTNQIVQRWYARPVFFVADLDRALHFYVDILGFKKQWHKGDGTGTVCQVHCSECEVILSQDATRSGRTRLYIELTQDGLDELRREIEERPVPSKLCWWGSNVIQIDDPDGNELLFPVLEQAGTREPDTQEVLCVHTGSCCCSSSWRRVTVRRRFAGSI